MDLFRLEPGDGAVDFTGSPRALDPSLVQVFYDGGTFDPVGMQWLGTARRYPDVDGARLRRQHRPVTGRTT